MKQKMLVRGTLPAGQTAVAAGDVWRGMLVLAEDGDLVGIVAAVVVADPAQAISHILLGQVPPTAVYRLVPIDLLDRLDGERLWLHVSHLQIAALPIHEPDC